MKRAIVVLLIIAAVGAGAGAYYLSHNGVEVNALTAPVTRGDIIDAVGATGTLQAVTTVQVGSQVSGNIQYLGADFNSIVKKGQVIARLDPSLFDAQLQQARASLNQSQANLTKAKSDLERAKVMLQDAQQKYTRTKELAAKSLLPQSDLDSAKIAVDSAQAGLSSQDATVVQTQAAVSQAQANLNQNQVNLDHTVIEAPIDGIVTQRSVDVGQTVAASMQAPVLFIIAADLTKMQVNANIDEADVGRIRPGQHVTFRVDAYPTETFEGTVAQVRLQPVVVQNVTTYGTVIDVPNPQLKLKPGMTATVKVQVSHKTDVLRIANAAIRFRPTTDIFAALNQTVPAEAQFGGGRGGRGNGRGAGATGGGTAAGSAGTNAAVPALATASTATPGAATKPGTPATAPGASASARTGISAEGGGGGQDGRRFGQGAGGNGDSGDRRAQMLERFKAMPPDQQKQFIERMKGRGQDVSAFETAIAPTRGAAPKQAKAGQAQKYGAPASGETIDALFPPLQPVESRGRAWLFVNRELKPVNVRLGVTDGTNTELLGGELQQNMEVVTGFTGVGSVRPQLGGANSGNPLLGNQPRGGPPGGFGGGGGGRGR